MSQLLYTLLWFVVALGGLVAIHEFGHFWVARRLGIKVLRFSIGFGKPLMRWSDRQGTEYWVSSLPLGGYVKLLDAREEAVPAELQAQEFSQRPVGQRILVYLAGPAINIVFACFLYWVLLLQGSEVLIPYIAEVVPDSPAEHAGVRPGSEIISVDGQMTSDWEQVNLALARQIGNTTQIRLGLKPPQPAPDEARFSSRVVGESVVEKSVSVTNFMRSVDRQRSPLEILGMRPALPDIPAVLGRIHPDSPAQAAGLRPDDRVLQVDGLVIQGWQHWVSVVRAHPEIPLNLVVERAGHPMAITLVPALVQDVQGSTEVAMGRIGAEVSQAAVKQGPSPDTLNRLMRRVSYDPFEASAHAWDKTFERIGLTLSTLGKMLLGRVSLDNLSGPITIAQVAADSAQYGWKNFLNFVAYLSISLGVLNLLPVPVLDGGHILMGCIEWVRGKPLSQGWQHLSLNMGVAFLAGIMLIAFYNDVMRIVF